MSEHIIGRRTFLTGAGAALGTAGALCADGFAQEVVAVSNSSGMDAPKLKVPAGACDCHHHIYDTRFPFSRPGARMVSDSRVSDYRLLQRRLGISRNIVVTPTPFPASVADNLVTLDALKVFGANARAVAIVYPEVTDVELKTLADGGVRAYPQTDRQGPNVGEAVDHPRQHKRRSAHVCRCDQGGAGIRPSRAGADAVGEQLAAPERNEHPG